MAKFGVKSIIKAMNKAAAAAAEKAPVIAKKAPVIAKKAPVIAKKASELSYYQKIDYALTETKEPYQLKQRQDLAFHRFTQFCDTQNILLLHNVGSGKTVTSLSIALNVLLKTSTKLINSGIGVDEIPVFKIITVTPTGLFNSFYSDLKNIANLIYGEIEFLPRDETGKELPFNDNSIEYNLLKYSAKVKFTYNMFPGELYNIEYKQIGINNAINDKKLIYNEFNSFISGSVCIFDEAHRLLRPLKYNTQMLLIDDMRNNMIENNAQFLSIKTIFMTGTPLSSSLNDTKKFMSFITGDLKFLDIDNKLYGNCFNDLITIKNMNEVITCVVTVPTQILSVVVAGSKSVSYFKNFGFAGTLILGAILFAINVKTGLIAGGAKDSDNNLITMPPKNDFDKKISELLLLNKEQLNDYTLSLIQKNKFNIPNLNKALQIVNYDQNYIEKIFNSINIYFSKTITTNGKLDKNKLSLFCEIIYNNLDEIADISKIISESNTHDLSNILLLIEPSIDYLNKKKVYIEDTNDSTIIEDKDRIEELNGGKINMSGAGDGDVMTGVKQAISPDPIKKIKNLFPAAAFAARIKYIVGTNKPFNVKKFAGNVDSFISLSDSRIQDTIVKTTLDSDYSLTKLISVQHEYQNLYEEALNVGPIVNPFPNSPGITPKFLLENPEYFRLEQMPISSNYPNKILNTILIEYSESQIAFFISENNASDKQNIYIHQPKNELTLMNRTIGNYSEDLLTVSCIYNIKDNIFVYSSTQSKDIHEPADLKKAIFCCTKFKQVFKMLLLMKCGYMYNFADTNKIISQSHFTTAKEDVPRETKDKTMLPLVYKDHDAVKNFLPLVYSISDFTGLGPFSAFIKSLGFEFILLHDLYSDKILADELIKTSQKSAVMPEIFKRKLINMSRANIDTYFTNLVEYALDNTVSNNGIYENDLKQLKKGYLCILLSAQYTEGLDMKYNPAIFLLEPPNTYGDFDQLCGRVLRTYSNNYYVNEPLGIQYNMFDPAKLANNNVNTQDDFTRLILPNKIIYQVLCCTNRDYTNLELSTAHGIFSINPTTVEKYNKTILPSLYFKSPSSNDSFFWNLFGKNGLTGIREVINLLTFDSLDFAWWFTLIDEGLILEQFLEYLNNSEYKGEHFKGISDIIQSKICFDTKQSADLSIQLSDDLCAEVAQLSNEAWVEKNKGNIINICGLGPIIIGDFVDTKGLIAIDDIYRAKIIEIMDRYNKDNPDHKPIITRELRNALSGSRYTKIKRDYAPILRPGTRAQRPGVEENLKEGKEKEKKKQEKKNNRSPEEKKKAQAKMTLVREKKTSNKYKSESSAGGMSKKTKKNIYKSIRSKTRKIHKKYTKNTQKIHKKYAKNKRKTRKI